MINYLRTSCWFDGGSEIHSIRYWTNMTGQLVFNTVREHVIYLNTKLEHYCGCWKHKRLRPSVCLEYNKTSICMSECSILHKRINSPISTKQPGLLKCRSVMMTLHVKPRHEHFLSFTKQLSDRQRESTPKSICCLRYWAELNTISWGHRMIKELKILKIFYALKSKEKKKASFSRWWKRGPLRKPSVTLWKLNNEKTIISLSQLETQAGVGTSSQTAFEIPNDLKQNEVHLTFLNLNNSLNKYIVLNQHRKCWAAAE